MSSLPPIPPTHLVFRDDAYRQTLKAVVLHVTEDAGIVLDRTVFYPTGGGQPGDQGEIRLPGTGRIRIRVAEWLDREKTTVVHRPATPDDEEKARLLVRGATVDTQLDWVLRHARMRTHTCLHLLSVALPYPVTGGAVGDGEGRLDFDIPDQIEREDVQAKLDALLSTDALVSDRWITDAELDANPGLVKTMSVQPPRGSGRVRLVEIAGLDLQPCGGTHVRKTSEIGLVTVTQIEKKGRLNRRVRIKLA